MAAPVVLVTRPEADAARVIARLGAAGLAALAWPLTAIRFVPGPVAIPEGTGALLFTSANGVAAFARASVRRDLPALCVGERTAEAARDAGFAHTESAGGDAAALAGLAAGHGARRMLHVRGRVAAGDLPGDLARHGIAVAEAVLYSADEVAAIPPAVRAALASGAGAILTAWSPRGAAILARTLAENPDWPCASLRAVAISAPAAAPLSGLGLASIATAARPDLDAMITAIREVAARAG